MSESETGSPRDPMNLSMFRAYDIRTPSSDLTPELNERLVRAEAVYFREALGTSGVIVAHDARLTGSAYLTAGAAAFRRAGLDVLYLPGVTSTSHFYFTAMRYPDYAAVMFGASHNPAGDTGQKILGPGVRPIAESIGPEGGLRRIRDLYLHGEAISETKPGRFIPVNNLDKYIDASMAFAGVAPGSLAGVPVFHDYLFGAGGREMLLAFHRSGAVLHGIHYDPDGRFPLGDPNPVKQNVIRTGLETLRSGDYLLGTFFDGDADRIDFYAGNGRYLSSSFVYAALLPYIVPRHVERRSISGIADPSIGVYADLKSNPLAIIEMAKAGVTVEVIRNGHSQIKNAMFEDPRMIGTVEESAHFYELFEGAGGPFATENSLYVALLATRAWKEKPERFEELFDLQDRTCREREWGHYFPTDDRREDALDAVAAHFEGTGASSLRETHSGLDLEATLLRRGMPFDIHQDTRLEGDWLQVSQRISQSENGLARWEVVAATSEIAQSARRDIERIAREFGGSDPYQG